MMIGLIALALAQAAAVTPAPSYSIAQPIGGNWSHAALPDGSEARFTGVTGQVQLALRCTRSTRRVTLSKPVSAPAPSLFVWTSGVSRTFAAPGFDASAGRLNVQLAAFDTLLDAMAFSRGRIAVGAGTTPALVVPPWPELARVVEDCRV